MSILNDQNLYDNDATDKRDRLRTSTKIVGSTDLSFVPSGATVVLAIAEIDLPADTWVEITLEKTRRNGLNIQNRSRDNDDGLDDIYVSGVDTDTSNPIPVGMKVLTGGERQYAIAEVEIYVKSIVATKITVEALG